MKQIYLVFLFSCLSAIVLAQNPGTIKKHSDTAKYNGEKSKYELAKIHLARLKACNVKNKVQLAKKNAGGV